MLLIFLIKLFLSLSISDFFSKYVLLAIYKFFIDEFCRLQGKNGLVIKNNNNSIKEIHCTYDPDTKGGWSQDGRKVKGTIHWVSINHAINATINIYNRLFQDEHPDTNNNFLDSINQDSLQILKNCKLEPSLGAASIGQYFQFLRTGYFHLDRESSSDKLIFNRTTALRDNWKKR